MTLVSGPYDKRWLFLFAILSLVAIFYLPYFVPVSPSASDSYLFGYNNKVGILLLLSLSAVGAIWTKGLNLNFTPHCASSKVPFRLLWLCLSLESAACAAMYFRVRRYGGFGESTHSIHQIWLLSYGKTPFIDFEWINGCALLYGPYWISRALHLSIPDSYYLFWWLASLAGIALLFVTVNLVDYPCRLKTSIFLVIAASSSFSVLSTGVNYTLLRYSAPLVFILLIYKCYSENQLPRAQWRAGAMAVLLTAILFVISPEVAIAHAAATIFLLFPNRELWKQKLVTMSYLTLLITLGVLFLCVFKLHILDGLILAAGGAYSFPIMPAPHIMLFIVSCFCCVCYLVRRFAGNDIRDNTIAIIAFAIPMTFPALSRCDLSHVFANGLGIFLAVFFYASASPRAWRWFCSAFVVCFLFIGGLLSVVTTRAHLPGKHTLSIPKNMDFDELYPALHGVDANSMLEAPFGFSPNRQSLYPSTHIDYGFYEGLFDAVTPHDVERKVNELARHPRRDLLLRRNYAQSCTVDVTQERLFVSIIFAFPYLGKPVHTRSIYKPLCDYILANYELAYSPNQRNFEYGLWKPKGAKAVSAQNEWLSQSSFGEAQPAGKLP